MGYSFFNPNPQGKSVGDCVVRAISRATGQSWEDAYIGLCIHGLMSGDMPSANAVWGEYLRSNGFQRSSVPDDCPSCYTVDNFAEEHPRGLYVVALSGHVVCVKDGMIYDTWDCGAEAPLYYWFKE